MITFGYPGCKIQRLVVASVVGQCKLFLPWPCWQARKQAGITHVTCQKSSSATIRQSGKDSHLNVLSERELKSNTDVGKASVRSEGQLCQALYSAGVTRSQLAFRAAMCYTPNLEATLRRPRSNNTKIPAYTYLFSKMHAKRVGSLVPQSPHKRWGETLRRRRTAPETRCGTKCYENSPSLAS